MRKLRLILILGVVAVSLLAGGWYAYRIYTMHPHKTASLAPVSESLAVPPLSQTYRNEGLRLSFAYPAGYTVREMGGAEGGTILIENVGDSERGIQIVITPYTDTDTSITAERVMRDIPDMDVEDPQPVSLGVAGEGLAFKSDNESFGGDSREVWFVVAGRLYQISTYAAYDKVLQAIMGTWTFF